MTDLVRHVQGGGGALSEGEFANLYRQARALAASGIFRDASQAEQAFAKIIIGRGLGLDPGQSLTAIHLVEGKPELSANLQAAMLRAYVGAAGERYDYDVLELTDEVAAIEFRRGDRVLGVERFTMADAQRAGLAGRNVWKSYPRNMLFARALSNGVAFYMPEVTFGHRVYGPGELGGEAEREVVEDLPTDARPTLDQPHAQAVVEVEGSAENAGDDEPVDAEVVEVDPDAVPRHLPPAERVIAAYNAAGRPADRLRAVLEDDEVDLSAGLFAAVRGIADTAQADRIVAALGAPS